MKTEVRGWAISRSVTRRKEQEDETEAPESREERGKQMTALRFHTGGGHQAPPWGGALET